MLDRNFTGKLDRRVQLLKPSTARDPVFNEKGTGFEIAYSNYPARRIDRTSNENENLDTNLIKGKVQVEWQLRFIPSLGIKTDWKLIDIFSGQEYNIIAPPTEIGRRQGITLVTELIQ